MQSINCVISENIYTHQGWSLNILWRQGSRAEISKGDCQLSVYFWLFCVFLSWKSPLKIVLGITHDLKPQILLVTFSRQYNRLGNLAHQMHAKALCNRENETSTTIEACSSYNQNLFSHSNTLTTGLTTVQKFCKGNQ